MIEEKTRAEKATTPPPKGWRNWFRSLTGRWSSGATGPQCGALWPSKDIAETKVAQNMRGWKNWDGKVEWLGAFPEGERP